MTVITAGRLPSRPNFFSYIKPVALCLLGVIATLSLFQGSAGLAPSQVIAGIMGNGDEVTNVIIRELRIPRLLLSLMVGAILAAAGAALQGYLRNPLAEPAILGASNAAALGAVIALHFGLASASIFVMPLFAGVCTLVAMMLLLAFSVRSTSTLTLVLTGIAISSLAGAGISLVLNMSSNPFAAMEIAFWLLGSVEDRSLQHVGIAAPFIAVGMILLLWNARALDALSLGEETARSLGFNMSVVRASLILGVSIGVGAAVSVAGSIGFVGLVAPHIARSFGYTAPSRVMIPSALIGAGLVTAADILVRTLETTNELKLGVVTAAIGGPFLVLILRRTQPRSFG